MAPSTAPQAAFETRHIGLDDAATDHMLKSIGATSLEQFLETVLPTNIRRHDEMQLKPALSEHQALAELQRLADKNDVKTSLIGMGY